MPLDIKAYPNYNYLIGKEVYYFYPYMHYVGKIDRIRRVSYGLTFAYIDQTILNIEILCDEKGKLFFPKWKEYDSKLIGKIKRKRNKKDDIGIPKA
jgi:hypothetical protein